MEFVTLSPRSTFDRVYLVSGLRRSGNHLLLQILACSFKNQSVLFINDIPDLYYDGVDTVDKQYRDFIKKGILSKELITISYGNSSLSCGSHDINECLIPREHVDDLENQTSTWKDRKKILIISFEDQEIERMKQVASAFLKRCNKLYKVIILRDVLNCLSSRFAYLCKERMYDGVAPSVKYKRLVEEGGFFKTNMDTIKLWKRHTQYITNRDYIIFNYNQFMCHDEFKKHLFSKLDIDFNPTLYEGISTYGHGSSYQATQVDLRALLTRFNKTTCTVIKGESKTVTVNLEFIRLLKTILSSKSLLSLLRDQFSMDIKFHKGANTLLDLNVCDKIIETINIPELLLIGKPPKTRRKPRRKRTRNNRTKRNQTRWSS